MALEANRFLKVTVFDFPSEVIEAEGSGGVSRSTSGRRHSSIRPTTEDPSVSLRCAQDISEYPS